jgi:hypothetical protein
MLDDREPRVDLLERLAAQQVTLNDQLIASTQRLERGQSLHDVAQHQHGEMLDCHSETMAAVLDIQERQQQMMDLLLGIQLGQTDRIVMLEQQAADLCQLMQAIRDTLEQLNGH